MNTPCKLTSVSQCKKESKVVSSAVSLSPAQKIKVERARSLIKYSFLSKCK